MSDRYTQFINSPFGRKLSRAFGFPSPVPLRRYDSAQQHLPGSVIAIGESACFEQLVTTLVEQKVDVRRNLSSQSRPYAVLIGVDHASTVEELEHALLQSQQAVKALAPQGRVVLLSRRPEECTTIADRAVQDGATGFLRSLAHELRSGATANGIQLSGGSAGEAPAHIGGLAHVLEFFLSARSAFVSGQFLSVDLTVEVPLSPTGLFNEARPLAGRCALVTGAAQGIGAEIARTLARDGAHVIGVDMPAAGQKLSAVCNEISGIAVQADITASDAAERILDALQKRGLSADIVVHNAGITRDKLFVNMDDMKFNSVLEVNLAAQLRFNETWLKSPVRGQRPRCVTLSSTSGIAGNRGQTNYATSKAGVRGMAAAAAEDFAQQAGTINAVAPGFIETEMTAKIPFFTREVARRLNSLQQGGQPADVAETIAFLVSDGAAAVNGQTLRVCGQNLVGA